MLTLQELSGRFAGVSWRGKDSFQCRCPCHDDKQASLTVSNGEKGLVLYCHSGCITENILQAIGLSFSDIMPDLEKPVTKGRFDFQNIVATYEYRNGTRKLRDGNKNFIWQHQEPDGSWKSGRGKAAHVLYQAGTAQQTVYLVEGEKDADNLSKFGLYCVSAEDGAGSKSKWRESYTAELKGTDVVIIPDNDDVGRRFAEDVAAKINPVTKSLAVVDLKKIWTELPEKGDVSDLIDHYKNKQTANVVRDLEQAAELWTLAPTTEARAKLETETDVKPEFFDTKGKFLFNVMGNFLMHKFHVCKINNALHIYDDGIYRPGENVLHGYMLKLIPTLSDARRKEVGKYLKANLDTPVREVSPPYLIPLKSKIYDIVNDRFFDYSPEYVFLNRFPYDYKPDAPCAETVDDMLMKIADYDFDVINLILETIGNCFYRQNVYRGTVFFYGPTGNNGKSTLLNMILQLIGRDNTSFLTLQDMSERFRLISIYGKALNICDDNGDGFLADSSVFKRVSTGGIVTAEHKGQDAIDFTPYCKCFYAMNSLPPVSDKSKAFFSRLLLVPLNADFSRCNRDASLKDKVWTDEEMEHLLRMSIDALRRLIENGDFTRPDSVKNALSEYEFDNNPVLQFLNDYQEEILGKPTEEGYSQYVSWCKDSGYKCITKAKFTRELSTKAEISTKPLRVPGYTKVVRCYVKA